VQAVVVVVDERGRAAEQLVRDAAERPAVDRLVVGVALAVLLVLPVLGWWWWLW
jgi:hypothetical protein